ncbi:protein FAM240C [Loxodonta africana]|uniref:protein FAM240C n=1 Tax=Loxodonta africana TaxID=9785 RepID=UPI0030D1F6B4
MTKSYTLRHHRRVTSDASELKMFWEKKIEYHAKQLQDEELRVSRSALSRLRDEWARKLEGRNKMLQGPPGVPKMSSLLPIESFHPEDKTAA